MKTIKQAFYCLLFTAFILFVPSNTKAQDDANAGIYVDGTFVDKIDCFTFDYLYCIFPITEKFKKYDMIYVNVKYDRTEFNKWYPDGTQAIFWFQVSLTREQLTDNFGDAKYGIYKFLRDKTLDNRGAVYKDDAYGTHAVNLSFKRNQFAGWDEIKPGKYKFYKYKSSISMEVLGATANGYNIDAYGNRNVKYGDGVFLYKSSVVPINNCESCPWDINVSCPVTGKKVDLKIEKSLAYEEKFGLINNFISNSPNNPNNEIKTNNTKNKNKTTTTTEKTTSTPAVSATALKPLDKKKPGYFAEKDGDQISREGYKKGDNLEGEVRSYDEGKIREITFYIGGQKNGLSTSYFDNGKIEMTGQYKNDEKQGEWKFYDSSGKLLETKKYVNGEVQD